MKKSGLNRLSKIGVILGAILLSLPVFSGGLSAETPKLPPQSGQTVQGKTVGLATAADEILPMKESAQAVQGKIVGNKPGPGRTSVSGIPPDVPGKEGKIVGNKLMLIDKTGRQTLAPDGIYTIQGGSKITVNQGQIIDIPSRVINQSGMVGIIDIEH